MCAQVSGSSGSQQYQVQYFLCHLRAPRLPASCADLLVIFPLPQVPQIQIMAVLLPMPLSTVHAFRYHQL